eukprot:13757413-Heterocapsa_arctica.AAC.1
MSSDRGTGASATRLQTPLPTPGRTAPATRHCLPTAFGTRRPASAAEEAASLGHHRHPSHALLRQRRPPLPPP